MKEEKVTTATHKFFIAGVKFHELKSVINDLSEGDNLVLIPEPDNKFDPNAIKIEFDYHQTMLGYVPKKFSSEVSAMIEVGKELECILVTLNKSAKPWEQAEVEIRVKS